ncbi:MAG: acyltransferase [Tepidisphaeraceae bacterium]
MSPTTDRSAAPASAAEESQQPALSQTAGVRTTHAMDHLPRLDTLRAIAALMVLVFHAYGSVYGWQIQPSKAWPDAPQINRIDSLYWLFWPARLGHFGVTLFFVLSGFCIHLSCLRATAGFHKRLSLVDYATRRIARIFPAYAVVLLVLVSPALLHGHASASFLGNIAAHLLFVHNLHHETYFSFNPSFWSLGVEAQYYVVYPLIFLPLVASASRRYAATLMLALSLVVSVGTQIYFVTRPSLDVGFAYLLPHARWFEWCVGMWMADQLWHGRRCGLDHPIVMTAAAIATVVMHEFPYQAFLQSTVASIFAAGLMCRYGSRTTAVRPVERWLAVIGVWSYSLYLIHQPLLARSIDFLQHRTTSRLAVLALVIVLVPAIFLGSAVLYRLVEKRGMKWGSALAKRWRTSKTPAN